MSKRQSFTILNETFPTKKALQERIRGILYSYDDGGILDAADQEFMADLLTHHSSYEQKCGVGIWYIYVAKNPVFPTKGFWLVRLDGSKTDFSYLECLKETSHRQRFERACRMTIHPYILEFKRQFFAGLTAPYNCPYTGKLLTYDNCHVDHMHPVTFQVLVQSFINEYEIDVDSVFIGGKGEDNAVYDYFTDDRLINWWVNYHAKHAMLQIISRDANLSVLRRKEPVANRPQDSWVDDMP